MPSDQGSRSQRLAGRIPLALAILLSLTLHMLLIPLVDWSWPEPSVTGEPVASLRLRLRPPQRPERLTIRAETAAEREPVSTQAPAEEIAEAQPESDPAPPQQNPALDFDALVRDAVKKLESDEPQDSIGGTRSRIGDSAFDPRLRERIEQSEDINTVAPAKRARVRSWQEPGGDLYVEVGDGGCFRVRKSWEAGVPARWEFTRCRGSGEKLQLDPKPYAQFE